jgi:hypothetical protein
LQKYVAVNGYYTANVTLLEIPRPLMTGACYCKINIEVINTYNFNITVQSDNPGLEAGHIRDDRLIWFTKSQRQLEI